MRKSIFRIFLNQLRATMNVRFFRMNRCRILGMALLYALLNTQANAISCTGPISYLGLDSGGAVVVSVFANGAGMHSICNSTAQSTFTITSQACRMYYATLLANRLAGRAVTIYYNDPNLTSCSQIGPWSTQTSAYFIEQTG